MRRRRLAAVALGLAVLVGGCGLAHEREGDATTKVAAQPGRIRTLLDVYNDARRRGDESRDPSVLRRVESPPLLDIDAGAYFVSSRVDSTAPVHPVQLGEVHEVVSPRFGSYPMWAGALVEDVGGGTRRFVVFERTHSAAPWLMTAAPELAGGSRLPAIEKDADGAAEHVPPEEADGLALGPQEAVAAYARALADASAVEQDLFEPDDFRRRNERFRETQQGLEFASFGQRWEARPVRHAVRLRDGGALVVGTLTRTDVYQVEQGSFIDWEDNAAAKAYLPGRVFNSARLTFVHQVLIAVPPRGKARVLGQYGGVVDGQGS